MSDYGSRGYGGSDDYGYGGDRGDYGRSGGYDRGGDYGRDGYGSGGRDHDYDRGRDYDRGGDYGSSGRDHDYDRSGRDYDRGGRGADDGYDSAYGDYGSETSSVFGSNPHDEPLTSGRAQVRDADPGSRARGSARVGGKRGPGRDLSPEEAEALRKAKKKKKRRRRLIALGCVVVMFLGIGTVAGSIFFDTVPLPEDIDAALDQSARILYEDGDEMATVGSEDRRVVTAKQIPNAIEDGLVAAEDRKFFEHDGVDFWGVARALWNNVTGGDTQGASTLEQQYVGALIDISHQEKSYLSKASEAVMAMKLGDSMSKDEILNQYLNLMPFGRQAFGVGAAAEAFYGKKVEDLSVSEGALLVAQLKASGGWYDPRDPSGIGKDDEGKSTEDHAEERWKYVLKSLLDTKNIKKDEYDEALKAGLPETIKPYSNVKGQDVSTGFVSHKYAMQEAADILDIDVDQISLQGYTIKTTINKKLQDAAVEVASKDRDDTYMSTQQKNLRAALVSVDPKTGGILAYFGGTEDGTGTDKAGYENMHPPGSSFKEFTMITAMSGTSLAPAAAMDSMWDGTSGQVFEHRGDGDGDGKPDPVLNADGNNQYPKVSMQDAIRHSLNTPIYAMTDIYGASNVLLNARAMGITQVQDPTTGDVYKLNAKDNDALLHDDNPRALVDNEIGFGQYPVSVKDMAVANATLANGGVYTTPHYVASISNSEGEEVYNDTDKTYVTKKAAIDPGVAADATAVASAIYPNEMTNAEMSTLSNGQKIAGKTGTWERTCEKDNPLCNQNSHIWYAGFTPQVSAAVWVGDKKDENGVVLTDTGEPGYGSNVSGSVWYKFMEKAMGIMKVDPVDFPPAAHVGDPNAGNLKTEEPKDDDDDEGDDEEDKCKPGDPGYPDCEDPADPGEDGVCDPNTPGDPDCVSDGECPDPANTADPDCGTDPGDDCNFGDPGFPNCDEQGESPSPNAMRQHDTVGTAGSPDRQVPADVVWHSPAAVREDGPLLT